MHYFMVHPLALQLQAAQNKPPVVQTQIQTVTQTKLQYVPGETVYLPAVFNTNSIASSQPTATNTVATKLDGKFEIGKPTFIYELNGKPGQFVKADNENYVFDKNMIELQQSSTITIKAEIPTIDLTRHNALTVGGLYTVSDRKLEPALNYVGSIGRYGSYSALGAVNGFYLGAGFKF